MTDLLITIGGRAFVLAGLAWVLYVGACIAVQKWLSPSAVVACSDCENEDLDCVEGCDDEGAKWDRGHDRWIDRDLDVAS